MADDHKPETGATTDRAAWARMTTMGKDIAEIKDALLGGMRNPGQGALHQIARHDEALKDHASRLSEAEDVITRFTQVLDRLEHGLGQLAGKGELLIRLEAQAETQKAEIAALKAEIKAQNDKALDRSYAIRLVVISAIVSLTASTIGGIFLRAFDRAQLPAPPPPRPAIWAKFPGGTP